MSLLIPRLGADLVLDKTMETQDDRTGVYTVTVTNDGPTDAPGVEVTDYVPAALTITDYAASQGAFNPDTGVWTIGDLDVGDTGALTLYATFDSEALYTNTVEVTGSDVPELDPDDNKIEKRQDWSGLREGRHPFTDGVIWHLQDECAAS